MSCSMLQMGRVRVNMWDVVTRNFKSSAIKGIELDDAVIVIDLDDNNRSGFRAHISRCT